MWKLLGEKVWEGVGREVRGRRDIGQGFGQGVGHLNYLAVPGVGIFEYFANI